jgi:hypothetical protein
MEKPYKSSSEYTRDEDSDEERSYTDMPSVSSTFISDSSIAEIGEGELGAMTYDEALMLLGGFGKV